MKNAPLWVAKHPLGLNELVKDFESVASVKNVKITRIVGMGGSGKTTLAKELFNRNFPSFEKCSFVFEVREAASRNALPDKQKKLLTDLGVQNLKFDAVDEGKAILANRLSSLRVLILLDDVDHIEQLNALLPNKDSLGSQSMVIITSRELGVLQSWGLSCIYKMPGLYSSHAEQLFCWHAFLQSSAPAGFETLVQKFIQVCHGLPLSLKVLGGLLNGNNSKDYWESQLEKISRILPGDIKGRLQLSYDALDDEEKEMFLDVACFLIRERKNTAIALWDGSGWNGLHGLQTLVNKCLVELVYEEDYPGENILYGEEIRMHDHLRDMGRELASKHSPYRLWWPQKIDNIKEHFKTGWPLRGIQDADALVAFKEYTHHFMGISNRRSKHRRLSTGLQILYVDGNEFTEEFASLSEDLVWVRWENFPLRNLPSWLTLRHLSVLELYGANMLEDLWADNVEPPLQLRELIIKGDRKLEWLPSSIRRLQYLKKLDFKYCGSSLPNEFCDLHSMEYLKLYSEELSSLPAGFGNLISLKHISLKWCRQLSSLPESFQKLRHLEDLDLSFCKMLSSLPEGIGNFVSLKYINLKYCKQLRTLPESFKQLIHLEHLYLSGCVKLKLKLDMLENIRKLKFLGLSGCEELEDLPHQIVNQTSLRDLDLTGCIKLRGSPPNIGELVNLQSLTIESLMFESLQPFLVNLLYLKSFKVEGSASVGTEDTEQVYRISISSNFCPNLETFSIWKSNHLIGIETVPVSLKMK